MQKSVMIALFSLSKNFTKVAIAILCFGIGTACTIASDSDESNGVSSPSESEQITQSSPSEDDSNSASEPLSDSAPASDTAPDASTAEPANEAIDTVIIPGEQVGTITATTSRDDLAAQFGEAALEDQSVHLGEGFMQPGTRVMQGDRSFTVVWTDESQSTPAEVKELGAAWQLPDEIGFGTSLAEMQDILGEFQVAGFGWDNAGYVQLSGTEWDDYQSVLFLNMSPAADADRADLAPYLSDRLFTSTELQQAGLDLQLSQITVVLNP